MHNLTSIIVLFSASIVLLGVGMVQAQTSASTALSLQAALAVDQQDGILGKPFVLDGSKSIDDGDVRAFSWKQVSGPFRFALEAGANVTITPSVAGTYVFDLVATDYAGSSEVVKKIELLARAGTATTNTGAVTSPAPSPQEASDMFLKIDTIKGESPDDAKKGNVEMNWKVEEGEKGAAEPNENDRLINAGPTTDWPTGGVHVAAADINGLTEEEKQEHLSSVRDWAEMKSGQDLQNFATGVLLKDVQMKGVTIQENLIEVDYSMPAKLFGLISMQYRASVSIDRGDNENWNFGNVKVKFPWYSFLLRKELSTGDLTTVVQQAGADEAEGGTELQSFGSAAKVLALVSNVLKTKHDTVKNSIGNVR